MVIARPLNSMSPFYFMNYQKISESKKGNKIRLGKKHSEETKRKISETIKQKNKK